MNKYTPTRGELLSALVAYRSTPGDQTPAEIASSVSPEELAKYLGEAERGLAEVERAAAEKAENERDCLRFELDGFRRVAAKDNEFLIGERDAALSTIAKVEGLHQPFEWSFGFGPVTSCKGCADQGVPQENASWPCPTICALGSVPTTGEGNDD